MLGLTPTGVDNSRAKEGLNLATPDEAVRTRGPPEGGIHPQMACRQDRCGNPGMVFGSGCRRGLQFPAEAVQALGPTLVHAEAFHRAQELGAEHRRADRHPRAGRGQSFECHALQHRSSRIGLVGTAPGLDGVVPPGRVSRTVLRDDETVGRNDFQLRQ